MDTAPKKLAPRDLKRKVFEACKNRGEKGATQEYLERVLPEITKEELGACINSLSASKHIRFLTDKSGKPFFVVQTNPTAASNIKELKTLTEEQLNLYRLIESVQREGIWTRNLKKRANMNRTFDKAIRVLESKKLIRSFKSVTAPFKKFYILAELEQANHHKGGIWYNSDLQFDEQFVLHLTKGCLNHIKSKGYATLEAIRESLEQSGISKVEVSLEDTKKLVDTLIADGVVESYTVQGETTYKPTRITMPRNGLTEIPCGVCSVAHLCGKTSEITPQNCVYFAEWLNF